MRLKENPNDDAFVDKAARVVRASMKGWEFSRNNPEEVTDIVLENDASGAQTAKHQQRMMFEIDKLTYGQEGKLDPADYQSTLDSLGCPVVLILSSLGHWKARVHT